MGRLFPIIEWLDIVKKKSSSTSGIVVRSLLVNADPNYNQPTNSRMKMLTDTLVDTPYKTQDPQSVGNTVSKICWQFLFAFSRFLKHVRILSSFAVEATMTTQVSSICKSFVIVI